jgi:AraC family transcriptional regulator, positive regulator of tynA and feaB
MGTVPSGTRNYESNLLGFEACNERLRRICGAYRVEVERRSEFRGSIETHQAGSLEFADVMLSGGRVVRDRDDQHYRGDHIFLIRQASGAALMRQRGSDASLRPGDCTLIDSRFPSVFEVGHGFHQYSFHLPTQLVMERFGTRTLPLARTIPADHGAGALLSQLLASAVGYASTLAGVELIEIAIELLAAALGLNAARGIPMPGLRRTMSLREITHFVDMHIDNPDLSPGSISAHFNTSVRGLYRVMGNAGWTPASLIWSRRLERARELLTQETCRAPIIDVALMCGFKDGAHFSRAYRKAFGYPPKAARHLAAAVPTPEN